MNNIITVIGFVLAGLLGLYFKSKADKAGAQADQASLHAEDSTLVSQQAVDAAKVQKADQDIQAIMDERKKLRDQYLTDQQKADSWSKK